MHVFEYYNQHLRINLKSNDDLPFPVAERTFLKGHTITQYGQVEKYVYFILDGIIEQNIIGADGSEKVIDFYEADSFVCCYSSFLTQQPSDVQMVSLSHCTLEVISYSKLQEAYKTSLIANQIGRLVTEHYYITKTNREKDFLRMNAEERYLSLLKQKPKTVATLPVNKIAKYLGIHPESLSRIRRKIIS